MVAGSQRATSMPRSSSIMQSDPLRRKKRSLLNKQMTFFNLGYEPKLDLVNSIKDSQLPVFEAKSKSQIQTSLIERFKEQFKLKNLHQISRFSSTAEAALDPHSSAEGLPISHGNQSSKEKLTPRTEAYNTQIYYYNMKKREENKFRNLKNRVILSNGRKGAGKPLKSTERAGSKAKRHQHHQHRFSALGHE